MFFEDDLFNFIFFKRGSAIFLSGKIEEQSNWEKKGYLWNWSSKYSCPKELVVCNLYYLLPSLMLFLTAAGSLWTSGSSQPSPNRIQKYKYQSVFYEKIAFRRVHGFWAIHWKERFWNKIWFGISISALLGNIFISFRMYWSIIVIDVKKTSSNHVFI
jgi:hypothetical protein